MKDLTEIGAALQTSGEWFCQHAGKASRERIAEEFNNVENLVEQGKELARRPAVLNSASEDPIWHVIMLTCEKREELMRETFARLMQVPPPLKCLIDVVRDADAIESLGYQIERPQERQEAAASFILDRFLNSGYRSDYLVFLEDDLEFNQNLWTNLNQWAPIRRRDVTLASLYNPTIRELKRNDAEHWFIADPQAIYGSQAMILSRECAAFVQRHWKEEPGMQDIKFSRLAARMGQPIYYHTPSLVQHVGKHSAWTTDDRFHQTQDFDPNWKA